MVPNIGILEIAIVLVIALIVFGPKRLPELGRSLGRGITEFREGVNSIGKVDESEDADDTDGGSTVDDDPEVTEIGATGAAEPEQVDGEVVTERQD
jgi:sec-independent protein translocase protein TatA